MSISEVRDYIQGQDRRERGAWERARLIVATQCDMKNKDLTDIIEFPWEKEPEEELKEPTEEDKKRLAEEAMKWQALLSSAKR